MLVEQLPPDSAFHRAVAGPDRVWTLANQLRAAQVDLLAGANWQRSGGKKKDRPRPIPRPGIEPDEVVHVGNSETKRTPAEIEALFAEIAEREAAAGPEYSAGIPGRQIR